MTTGCARGFNLHAICCALCWLHGCGVNVAKSAAPKQLGSGGVVEEKHWRVTRWGERRPWCAPCASLSGGRNQKKKKEGSGTGARVRVESRQGAGKGEKKELSGRRWVPVSTASAGVDACAARSNRTLGLGHCVSLGVSISQNYSNNNFSALAVLMHCA